MEPLPSTNDDVKSPEATSLLLASLYASGAVFYATHFWNAVDVMNQQGLEPRTGAQLVGSLIVSAFCSKGVVDWRPHLNTGQQG